MLDLLFKVSFFNLKSQKLKSLVQREKSERHNFDVETSLRHQKQACAVRDGWCSELRNIFAGLKVVLSGNSVPKTATSKKGLCNGNNR